jgi:hypothetical protein
MSQSSQASSSQPLSSQSSQGSSSELTLDDVNVLPRGKRSLIWSEISPFTDKYGVAKCRCNTCGATFKNGGSGSTSAFRNHIKRFHPKIAKRIGLQVMENGSVIAKKDFFDMKTTRIMYSEEEFQRLILTSVVVKDRAFTFVEDKYLRKAFEMSNPSSVLCSATKIREDIMKLYDIMRGSVVKRFDNYDGKLHLTSDGWTSPNTSSYMSVTCHYAHRDGSSRGVLLDFIHCPNSHTGIYLAQKMHECLEEYGIADKVMSITLDNADNNRTFFEAMHSHGYWSSGVVRNHCIAHVINLASVDCLEVVRSEVATIRKICYKIRGSPLQRSKFIRVLQSQDAKVLLPIMDVSTRWNSTLDMLERAILLKPTIVHLLCTDRDYVDTQMDLEQWTKVEKMIAFLRPFKQTTVMMSAVRHPTMSGMLPVLMALMKHLRRYVAEGHRDCYYEAAESGIAKLKKYYDRADITAFIAVVMDPRLKLSFFEAEQRQLPEGVTLARIRECMVQLFERDYREGQASTCHDVVQETLDDEEPSFLSGMFPSQSASGVSGELTTELDKYLNSELCDSGIDPLEWWVTQAKVWPSLGKMARDYLGMCASSVASEQVFSSAKRTVSPHRCCLLPETIRATQCLKAWLEEEDGNA